MDERRSVYFIMGYTDMRKSIDTLAIQISSLRGIDIMDGSRFVFCNKKKTIVKILYWDMNGFCLLQKRMEKEHFYWPEKTDSLKTVSMKSCQSQKVIRCSHYS